MLAAQLSITLSIHGEGYQNHRSRRVCLLAQHSTLHTVNYNNCLIYHGENIRQYVLQLYKGLQR